MTFRLPANSPAGAPPEPTTTRVASGSSARLVAITVAALLVGVVGFVVVSRPPESAAPSPSAPGVALAPTSPPTVAPSPTPTPSPTPAPWDYLLGGSDPAAYEYAVSTLIPGGRLRVGLNPLGQGLYVKELVIDTADLGETLELDIDRGWTKLGVTTFETMDRWQVGLQPLLDSRGLTITLLSASGPNGYTFTVTGRQMRQNATFLVELVFPAYSLTGTGPSGSSSTIAPSSTNAG